MAEVTEIARARVAKLVSDWDWPDPSVLEDILALGAEAVPALDALLTPELLRAAHADEQADVVVYYALELLSALETPAAIPVFLNAYRLVTDDTLEELEEAVRRLGPEAVDGLLAVVADPALSWYVRSVAANGAVHHATRDPVLRERVAAGLRAVLSGYLEQAAPLTLDEKEGVAYLIVDLADMADPEARPLINAAFATGRMQTAEESSIGIAVIDMKGVEELYQKGGRSRIWEPPPLLEDYRKRRQEHLDNVKKRARLKLLTPDRPPQPVVLSPKIGRNDPCWCGSGLKYKKCHLAQDEKERVRL